MNPILKLKKAIKNKEINHEILSSFKCRHCNDSMPIIAKIKKQVRFSKNGSFVTMTQTIRGNRIKGLRRMNANQKDVDQAVSMFIEYIKSNENIMKSCFGKVNKESVSKILGVPEDQVKFSFQKLNQLGKLSQAINIPPHDSKRDFWGGNDSSWMGSSYKII